MIYISLIYLQLWGHFRDGFPIESWLILKIMLISTVLCLSASGHLLPT